MRDNNMRNEGTARIQLTVPPLFWMGGCVKDPSDAGGQRGHVSVRQQRRSLKRAVAVHVGLASG